MKKYALVLIVAITYSQQAAAAVVVNFDADDKVTTVTGINVGGTTYDATFTHGVSYDDWIEHHGGVLNLQMQALPMRR